ncbi:triose-phosphate isomerase [Croceiramulus getboli]|nr:triose-phosphate isomerase [Flavobacteriaceae bacterium YJPT1-3]
MRTKIVAGNWKMNLDLAETTTLIAGLKKQEQTSEAQVIIAPPFTNLYAAFEALRDSDIHVAGQNVSSEEQGAFTGEVSAKMLRSVGAQTVLIGHSERRAIFGESDELLAKKVSKALEHEMTIIFCFGEDLKDRKHGEHFEVVRTQIKKGLFHLEAKAWKHVVLAYEPVWAIGTGETASPEQAQEMHAFIRTVLEKKYDESLAQSTSILYGGSVKPNNAAEIFSKKDVDGGLIGGASLNAADFYAIVNAI